jgi:hypothetical protein
MTQLKALAAQCQPLTGEPAIEAGTVPTMVGDHGRTCAVEEEGDDLPSGQQGHPSELCKMTVFRGTPTWECHRVATLRTEQKDQWSSVLRVFFPLPPDQGQASPATQGQTTTAEKVEPTIYRIEWWVYWADKDQWLMSVRDRMRDRVLDSISGSPRTWYPDQGASHRYEWGATATDTQSKDYITFDISYKPQMMLIVSGGEYQEVYALRDDAFKKGRSCRTDSDNSRSFFLSRAKDEAESPLLPLPPGLSPQTSPTPPPCPIGMK